MRMQNKLYRVAQNPVIIILTRPVPNSIKSGLQRRLFARSHRTFCLSCDLASLANHFAFCCECPDFCTIGSSSITSNGMRQLDCIRSLLCVCGLVEDDGLEASHICIVIWCTAYTCKNICIPSSRGRVPKQSYPT